MDPSLYLVTGRELLPPGKVRVAIPVISNIISNNFAHFKEYLESLEEVLPFSLVSEMTFTDWCPCLGLAGRRNRCPDQRKEV